MVEHAAGGEKPSYHDLHITTRAFARTSIFDLPYGVEVLCTRVGGWQVWQRTGKHTVGTHDLLGGEYDGGNWLVLDVAGHVLVDSRPLHDADCPMTNARPEARTVCVCDTPGPGGERDRDTPEGGT